MGSHRREFLQLGVAVTAGLLTGCGNGGKAKPPPPRDASPPPSPALPPWVPSQTFADRRRKLAQLMNENGLDYLVATPGSSLLYLTGARFHRSERLLALVVRNDATCQWLGPSFEADRLEFAQVPGTLKTWEEAEDPIPLLAEMLSGKAKKSHIGLEGTTWYDTLAPLVRLLPSANFRSATPLLAGLRMRKDPAELAIIRYAIQITLDAIRRIQESSREGITEKDLLEEAVDFVSGKGGTLSGLVQFGPTSAIPHAGAGDRKLRSSDVVLIDFVTRVRDYHCDISRTFSFGSPSPRFQEVFETVRKAQEEGIQAVRPGITAGMVDQTARNAILRRGFGERFTHRLGHGFGLDGHEPPYLVAKNRLVLQPGMTVTVEPGVYLPGEFGVRLEDDILVTEEGRENLSAETLPHRT